MYTVMLVDDDYPVLEFLSQTIPWEKLGLKHHSACSNGMEALEKARVEPPDIIITDIGMPHMDGLELIEELRKLNPRLSCMILSCMDDFAHAQRAMRLKVNDYVLKETMEAEQITQLLLKLKEELMEDDRRDSELEAWKSLTVTHASALRHQLLQQMITSEQSKPVEWAQEAGRLGIHFDGQSYLPVLFFLSRLGLSEDSTLQDQQLVKLFEEAAEEVLLAFPGAMLLPSNRKEQIVLLPYKRMLNVDMRAQSEPYLLRMQAMLASQSALPVTVMYGSAAAEASELGRNLGRLIGLKQDRFYLHEGGIYMQTAVERAVSNEDIYAAYQSSTQQISDAFLEEDEELLELSIQQWMEHIRLVGYSPELVKEWTLKIMYDNQARFMSMEHYQSKFSLEVLHKMLSEIDTLDELIEWMQKFFKDRLPLVSLIYQQSRRSEIMRAQQYVNKNIGKKITLEEVADMLHINSSYFSRLFKKETGHNFIQYVTLAKMERAKELLAKTNISVEDVAERLGYDNKSYFTKLFKKYTGGTPGRYRVL